MYSWLLPKASLASRSTQGGDVARAYRRDDGRSFISPVGFARAAPARCHVPHPHTPASVQRSVARRAARARSRTRAWRAADERAARYWRRRGVHGSPIAAASHVAAPSAHGSRYHRPQALLSDMSVTTARTAAGKSACLTAPSAWHVSAAALRHLCARMSRKTAAAAQQRALAAARRAREAACCPERGEVSRRAPHLGRAPVRQLSSSAAREVRKFGVFADVAVTSCKHTARSIRPPPRCARVQGCSLSNQAGVARSL
jgi:hypothetical protein